MLKLLHSPILQLIAALLLSYHSIFGGYKGQLGRKDRNDPAEGQFDKVIEGVLEVKGLDGCPGRFFLSAFVAISPLWLVVFVIGE